MIKTEVKITGETYLHQIMVEAGVCKDVSEAKRLIIEGAVFLNCTQVTNMFAKVGADLTDNEAIRLGGHLLKVGRQAIITVYKE